MHQLQASVEDMLAPKKSITPRQIVVKSEEARPMPIMKKRILIAEDDNVNQIVLKRMLEDMGYELDIVDSML